MMRYINNSRCTTTTKTKNQFFLFNKKKKFFIIVFPSDYINAAQLAGRYDFIQAMRDLEKCNATLDERMDFEGYTSQSL